MEKVKSEELRVKNLSLYCRLWLFIAFRDNEVI